jgi:hypothetical protein
MRAKLVTFGLTAVAILALVLQALPQAIAQGNANKPAPAKKAKQAKPAPKPEAKPAAPAPPAAGGEMMAKPKPKPKPKRKASMAMAGVPKGVPACIERLTKLAEKDPLINYDGHPSEIVNNGLLWNDPKSHCSVGSDDAMKKKVVDLADAWRRKDAAQVRSLLQELAAK